MLRWVVSGSGLNMSSEGADCVSGDVRRLAEDVGCSSASFEFLCFPHQQLLASVCSKKFIMILGSSFLASLANRCFKVQLYFWLKGRKMQQWKMHLRVLLLI